MRTTILLVPFVLGSLMLPARADLLLKPADPAQAMTRGADDDDDGPAPGMSSQGGHVDSFFGDIGDFFTKDVPHVMQHNVAPVGSLIGKGVFMPGKVNSNDLNNAYNGLTTRSAPAEEAPPK
jgi:hypothetical protein